MNDQTTHPSLETRILPIPTKISCTLTPLTALLPSRASHTPCTQRDPWPPAPPSLGNQGRTSPSFTSTFTSQTLRGPPAATPTGAHLHRAAAPPRAPTTAIHTTTPPTQRRQRPATQSPQSPREGPAAASTSAQTPLRSATSAAATPRLLDPSTAATTHAATGPAPRTAASGAGTAQSMGVLPGVVSAGGPL